MIAEPSAAGLTRLAVINTHPTQHFAPLWRELTKANRVQVDVIFVSDSGVAPYFDPGFGTTLKWDVDLESGYRHHYLSRTDPAGRIPERNFVERLRTLTDFLDKCAPDVVVLFGYALLENWFTLRWARKNRARVLIYCDSELKRHRARWRRLVKILPVRAFLALADGFLPVGDSNKEYYSRYGAPADAMYPCVLPVDATRFRLSADDTLKARASIRTALGVCDTQVLAICVGKFVPGKRQMDLIQAVARSGSNVQSRLVVALIGDGPTRPELERAIEATPGKVVVTGFVNQTDIVNYYAAADILVVPSDTDAHPLVVTEGLFFGLPVIASDSIGCIGPTDTTRPDVNALVYSCGDVDQLATHLSALVEQPAYRAAMAEESLGLAESQDCTSAARKFEYAAIQCHKRDPRGIFDVLAQMAGR